MTRWEAAYEKWLKTFHYMPSALARYFAGRHADHECGYN